jgi:hypothetical protein
MHGARLRQSRAGVKTKIFRRFVDGGEQFDIAALAGDDERPLFIPPP